MWIWLPKPGVLWTLFPDRMCLLNRVIRSPAFLHLSLPEQSERVTKSLVNCAQVMLLFAARMRPWHCSSRACARIRPCTHAARRRTASPSRRRMASPSRRIPASPFGLEPCRALESYRNGAKPLSKQHSLSSDSISHSATAEQASTAQTWRSTAFSVTRYFGRTCTSTLVTRSRPSHGC